MDDDEERCNWCEKDTGNAYIRGGIGFCDDICADEYEEEWGLIDD